MNFFESIGGTNNPLERSSTDKRGTTSTDVEKIDKWDRASLNYKSGHLVFSKLRKFLGLNLDKVTGDLRMPVLEELKGERGRSIEFPECEGVLDLKKLKRASHVRFSRKVGEAADFSKLTVAESVVFPEEVEGSVFLEHLEKMDDSILPKKIGRNLYLQSLRKLDGHGSTIEHIGGDFELSSATEVKKLTIKQVDGQIIMPKVELLSQVKFPQKYKGTLALDKVSSIVYTEFPEQIDGDLKLDSVTEWVNPEYNAPRVINGNFSAKLLKYLEKQKFGSSGVCIAREKVSGNIELPNLRKATSLALPPETGGSVSLPKLEDASGIDFGKRIGRSLNLDKLKTGLGLKLPSDGCGGAIMLGIESAKGFRFPNESFYRGASENENQFKRRIEKARLEAKNGPEYRSTIEYGPMPQVIYFRELQSLNGLRCPLSLDYDLDLSKVRVVKSNDIFQLPQVMSGYLNLSGLERLDKSLELPTFVRSLSLGNVKDLDKIIFPDTMIISGFLDLSKMEECEPSKLIKIIKILLKNQKIVRIDLSGLKDHRRVIGIVANMFLDGGSGLEITVNPKYKVTEVETLRRVAQKNIDIIEKR